MNTQRTHWTLAALLAVLILAGPALAATNVNYTGGDSFWPSAANWDQVFYPGQVNAGTDIGLIDNGGTVSYSGGTRIDPYGVYVGTLAGSSGGTFNLNGFMSVQNANGDPDGVFGGLRIGNATGAASVANFGGSGYMRLLMFNTSTVVGVQVNSNGTLNVNDSFNLYDATGDDALMQMSVLGGTLNVTGTATVTMGDRLTMDDGATANFSGGTSNFRDSLWGEDDFTLNVNGGWLEVKDQFYLGRHHPNDGAVTSQVTLSSGTMHSDFGGAYVGKSWSGGGDNTQSHAYFTISGGTLDLPDTTLGDLVVGLYSHGELSVQGDDATINVGERFWLGQYATLEAVFDSSNFSLIDAGGNAVFDAGSELNVALAPGFTPTGPMTWTVANWDGTLTDDGLAFASGVDTDVWSFNVDEVNNQLTVSYVPEPTTLGLLGLGGLALLRRRSRKA